jgi:hypothetical protein
VRALCEKKKFPVCKYGEIPRKTGCDVHTLRHSGKFAFAASREIHHGVTEGTEREKGNDEGRMTNV